MIDFTSALYLGMKHDHQSLPPWRRLTTGVPAALRNLPEVSHVEAKLAAMQGCEQATLAPSTLHLFWDLFGMWPANSTAVYFDEAVYPIARWGVERAATRHIPVFGFRHLDAVDLQRKLGREPRRHPLIVSDAFCPACGKRAPVGEYVRLAREGGGRVIVDDTQGLGIFGYGPRITAPYGRGGGGTLRRACAITPEVIMIASLAKGFGVPIAALSGDHVTVDDFVARSDCRVHCSPPSAAHLAAALNALAINEREGDALRFRLARRVALFRAGLRSLGLVAATGSLFPIQAPALTGGLQKVHKRLLQAGINTLLHQGPQHKPRVSFILTVSHSERDINRAVQALAGAAQML